MYAFLATDKQMDSLKALTCLRYHERQLNKAGHSSKNANFS